MPPRRAVQSPSTPERGSAEPECALQRRNCSCSRPPAPPAPPPPARALTSEDPSSASSPSPPPPQPLQAVASHVRTLKRKLTPQLAEEANRLKETLRSAEELCTSFSQKHWLKKMLQHVQHDATFKALFATLDRAKTTFGFALEVAAHTTQARRAKAAEQDAEKVQQLLQGNASMLSELQADGAAQREQLAELMALVRQAHAPAADDAKHPSWHVVVKNLQFIKMEDDFGDTVKQKLGAGSFGAVYCGTFKGAAVAVKEMPINRPADLKDFEAEISHTFML